MASTNSPSSNCLPGGMLMPGRGYSGGSGSYRFGFNGKENDNEIKGEGNSQDYGMRFYDPRVVRFMSVDPIAGKYPELTPYQFASNSPIAGIDLDGMELQLINTSMYRQKYLGTVSTITETNHLSVVEVVKSNVPHGLNSNIPATVGPYGHNSEWKGSSLSRADLPQEAEDDGSDLTTFSFKNGIVTQVPSVAGGQAAAVVGLFEGVLKYTGYLLKAQQRQAAIDEKQDRSLFYKATKIIDEYASQGAMKKLSETFKNGQGRADLINYVNDGTLPPIAKNGSDKAVTSSTKYRENVQFIGNQILNAEGIKNQQESSSTTNK